MYQKCLGFYLSTCDYPIVPALFVESTVLCERIFFLIRQKSVVIVSKSYMELKSVPLTCLSLLRLISDCLDYYNFITRLEIR